MNTEGNVIVFGSFALIVAVFAGGFFVTQPWSGIMIGAAIIAGIAWMIFMLWLASAMNSDI